MRISEDEARLDRLRMYMRWFDDQDVAMLYAFYTSGWMR